MLEKIGDYMTSMHSIRRESHRVELMGRRWLSKQVFEIELKQPEDAIPWLRMALKAKRYESYCFPRFNLGRIYEAQNKLELALENYRDALNENPGYAMAAKAIERVKARLGSLQKAKTGEA